MGTQGPPRKCDGPLPFDRGASKNSFSLSAWGGPGERFGPFYVNSGQKRVPEGILFFVKREVLEGSCLDTSFFGF